MGWRAGPGEGREVPVDIRLERADGGTLLRLVHSGFLSDASWDDEFESHGRGWSFELRSLKFYLENFLGKNRQYVVERFPIPGELKDSWAAIVGAKGVFTVPGSLEEGDEFQLKLPSGELTTSRVLYQLAGTDFAAACDILQGGLIRYQNKITESYSFIGHWDLSFIPD